MAVDGYRKNMNYFRFLCVAICGFCVELASANPSPFTHNSSQETAASGSGFPFVWMSTQGRSDMEATIRDCAEHGVDCVEVSTWQLDDCRRSLAALRKCGVKGFTSGPDPSKDSRPASRDGKPCERAVCIGGAYRGLSIDRNLFSFTAGPHEIIVEPPVYSRGQPYTRTVKGVDGTDRTVHSGHYFGSMRPTGKAEIVVPERLFDGAQHLRIIPCEVMPAASGDTPENDTSAGLSGPEIENRLLVRLRFDLTDCADCLLDKVGIAVYWESDPESDSWKRGSGQLSVFSELTRERARFVGSWRANQWALANEGTFPSNEIVAIRFGDECFNLTGWLDSPACSFPLWGFSPSGQAAFAAASAGGAGGASSRPLLQPRTCGYPEIYGAEAYGIALYSFHQACAELTRAFRDGVREITPDLLVFRNTTRAGVWSESNDRDGSGQELLARELDFLHIDPYPVAAGGYASGRIPEDMGYMAGLARRYGKPLVPWMQAHAYAPSGLGHVTPEQMRRMWAQHEPFAPAAIMWLGYGAATTPGRFESMTFPNGSPESWEYAKELHAELHGTMGGSASPRATLAVVRPYSTRASCCSVAVGRWRNPADRILETWALAWGVDNGLQYDVFEMPPAAALMNGSPYREALASYPLVVSTVPIPGVANVRVLGEGTEGTTITANDLAAMRKAFAAEIAAMKLR